MLSTIFGLMIATIGIDLQSGQPRYTMGVAEFQDGVGFVVVVVGLFAVAEVFRGMEEMYKGTAPEMIKIRGKLWLTKEEWQRSVGPIWRGGVIGFIIGVLPGAGGTIASILSYTTEKRLSKHPEEFGRGAIEGVAGPESANNAGAQTSFIPLLTLGIPENAVMAMMIGAMTIHNIQPGPQVMTSNPQLFWGLIASMWVGNLMLVVLNLPLIGIWIRLLTVPYRLLYPAILLFCGIGVYTVNNTSFDVMQTSFFGAIGVLFAKLDCEPAPLLLGFVLGPMMEENLRRALLLSRGDPSVFATRPISAGLLAAAILLVLVITLPNMRRRREEAFQEA
jgi:TctA family transporter